jgi:hypothetical protein
MYQRSLPTSASSLTSTDAQRGQGGGGSSGSGMRLEGIVSGSTYDATRGVQFAAQASKHLLLLLAASALALQIVH